MTSDIWKIDAFQQKKTVTYNALKSYKYNIRLVLIWIRNATANVLIVRVVEWRSSITVKLQGTE
jgi:hypothetical protein